jgi:hypothetical protein
VTTTYTTTYTVTEITGEGKLKGWFALSVKGAVLLSLVNKLVLQNRSVPTENNLHLYSKLDTLSVLLPSDLEKQLRDNFKSETQDEDFHSFDLSGSSITS